jgi:hypothetical protein
MFVVRLQLLLVQKEVNNFIGFPLHNMLRVRLLMTDLWLCLLFLMGVQYSFVENFIKHSVGSASNGSRLSFIKRFIKHNLCGGFICTR